MNKKHLALWVYLGWLLLISYSQHISHNSLLVLYSPLGLIPTRYLFSDEALALPLGLLTFLFALIATGIVGISVLAWRSRKVWIHTSYWGLTIWFGIILVLVDIEGSWFTKRLIASWTPDLSSRSVFVLLAFCLLGLAATSWYLSRGNQISRTALVTFLSGCLIGAWFLWHMRIPRFESTKEFSEGLAAVYVYGQWGYIDTSMRTVIPPQFSYAWPFTDGLARVNVWSPDGGSRGVYIDKSGKVVLEMSPEGSGAFWEGLAQAPVGLKYGFIDKTGTMVIPPTFDGVRRFSEGRAAVMVDSKYGFIDKSGRMVIAPQFDAVSEFSEGLAPVQVRGQWGFIDPVGQLAISTQFSSASGFHEGLAVVSIHVGHGGNTTKKYGYIDKTGRFVISPQFDDADDFSGQVAEVILSGRRLSINRNGEPTNR